MLVITFVLAVVRYIHPFLAINQPVNGELLVVEGWIPKYALQEAKRIFDTGNYNLIAIVGITNRNPEVASYSEKAASYFINNGIDRKKIFVTSADYTTINETKSYAFEFKKQALLNNLNFRRIDVLSIGTHCRKSFIVFKKIFPDDEVGIISIRPSAYNPQTWWLSTEGWKWVVMDTIKYVAVLVDFSNIRTLDQGEVPMTPKHGTSP